MVTPPGTADKIDVRDVTLHYSDGTESLRNINVKFKTNAINVLFGPAGGGKSSLLRLFNRLNDLADVVKMQGEVLLDGENILSSKTDINELRRRVGMVFAQPIALPMSIRDNLTYGLKLAGEKRQAVLDEAVESSLKQAAIWDEVKDRLDTSANALSGGQRQRVCLARTLALHPEVILLDEPTSGLDPVSTGKVEESLQVLKEKYTIILVPHSVQQAARTADYAAFMLQGEMIEWAPGKEIFINPQDERTEDYVLGRFG
ncbi:MAG: phosphate ABC transporter ATP-binding protein [Anaerolineales bacterium]|nr:phosphate ABC transporter ATP-binding protein [Anaerolineales bacterium]